MLRRRFFQGTPRTIITFVLIASLILTIGCTSLAPIVQEEGSTTPTAEKLIGSGDFVVYLKDGKAHRFKSEEARILALEGKRWIKGSGNRKIAMEDVESIQADTDLLIRIGNSVEVEFPAGRWRFLVRDGVLDSVTGAGMRTDEVTGEDQNGIFTVPLADVTEMSARETDTLATIGLVTGITLVFLAGVTAAALGSMEFNFDTNWGK